MLEERFYISCDGKNVEIKIEKNIQNIAYVKEGNKINQPHEKTNKKKENKYDRKNYIIFIIINKDVKRIEIYISFLVYYSFFLKRKTYFY